MPIYEYQGQQYEISDTDPKVAKEKILKYLGGETEKEVKQPEPVKEDAATGLSALVPSIQRGYYQTESLLGDVLPAMAGRVGEKIGVRGAKEYADKQMRDHCNPHGQFHRFTPTACLIQGRLG